MTEGPTRFRDVAGPLAANGYRPVPIAPGKKYPGFADWQRFAYAPGCERDYPRHGAGVLLGDVVGVDIDVDDPDAAAAVENAAREVLRIGDPAEIPRRIGREPRVLLPFRCAAPFGKLRSADFRLRSNGELAHVELLAEGQQFVAYHVHPATGRPYTWNGGGDLCSVPRDELPEITEAQAREVIRVAEAILGEWGDRVGEDRVAHGDEHADRREVAFAQGGRNSGLTRIAGKLRRAGLCAEEIAGALHAVNAERCDPPLDRQEVQTIAHSVGRYDAPSEEIASVEAVDATTLLAIDATPTRWIVDGWLAEGASGLLGSHGGHGKSWLALQGAACIASGAQFLGLPVARRRVLFYACEDRAEIIRHRLHRIVEALGLTLEAGWLHIVDQTRQVAELLGRGERGAFGFTLLYELLRQAIERSHAEVLIVDSASDAFGGSEIVRGEVRRYITEVQALVPVSGAVLHLVHVDKAHARGTATGQAYSGSTAWHNSVRMRWELARVSDEADDDRRRTDLTDPRRLLTLAKSNYGPAGAELPVRFDHEIGAFVTDGPSGGIVDAIRDRTEQQSILRTIVACQAAGIPVPAAMQGPRTAYLVLSSRSEFPDALRGGARAKTRRFARHIESLRQIRRITEGSYRRSNRHIVATIEPTPEGRAECANS